MKVCVLQPDYSSSHADYGEYDPSRFLTPQTVAQVTADAINAPPDAHLHEVIVRPRR